VSKGKSKSSQVRIIGGIHRGRKLPVPEQPGLRPTGDRVRETLFNWLQPLLPGAACLDLFAGSGALGLEAASRGAGRVLMLEKSAQVARQLEESVALLGLEQVRVEQADALARLQEPGQAFDIVFLDPPFSEGLLPLACQRLQGGGDPFDILFLDPPFAEGLLPQACQLLQENGWLKPDARVYIEQDAAQMAPELPPEWRLLKEKKAGQVVFILATNG
jgi:16S rRNA (guanine966-N2)-methyltransferase